MAAFLDFRFPILGIFDLQVTPMLPSKFGVHWPFGSGEEAKNRFSRWRPWRPSWISDRHDFSYFWSTSPPDASYHVNWPRCVGGVKAIVDAARRTTHDGHWLPTITHHEHFVLRWVNKAGWTGESIYFPLVLKLVLILENLKENAYENNFLIQRWKRWHFDHIL